jgi:hypothetical protein
MAELKKLEKFIVGVNDETTALTKGTIVAFVDGDKVKIANNSNKLYVTGVVLENERTINGDTPPNDACDVLIEGVAQVYTSTDVNAGDLLVIDNGKVKPLVIGTGSLHLEKVFAIALEDVSGANKPVNVRILNDLVSIT